MDFVSAYSILRAHSPQKTSPIFDENQDLMSEKNPTRKVTIFAKCFFEKEVWQNDSNNCDYTVLLHSSSRLKMDKKKGATALVQ